jgi:release factor glutamine methyltransferase
MTLGQILRKAETRLGSAGISSARLDALILLEDMLHKDRAWILAHPEHGLSNLQTRRLDRKIERRAGHVPLAYIRGHAEFYGRTFKVNRHVLQPRMETEVMIELLKDKRLPPRPAIADVGTGTGCLGITASLEIPGSIVDLYDISSGALAVAKHNIHLHELHLHARKMNLLSRPLRPYDAIITSLPYVPDKWQINQAAMAEPRIAIFGGSDGLEVYRKLFHQLQRFTWKPRYVLTESLPPQHEILEEIALLNGFKLVDSRDFIQVFTPV